MSVFGAKLTKLSSFETKAQPGEKIVDIDPDLIDYLPQQRTEANPGLSPESLAELGQNLKRDGQQLPVVLRPNPDAPGRLIMVAGERRARAAKLEGLKLKAVIREMTQEQHLRIQRAENIHREALTNQEIAQALATDKARLGTLEAVAKEWQRSVNWVSERLRYLDTIAEDGIAAQAIKAGVTADVSTITDLAKLAKADPAAAQAVIDQAQADPKVNVRQAVRSQLKEAKSGKEQKHKKPGKQAGASAQSSQSAPGNSADPQGAADDPARAADAKLDLQEYLASNEGPVVLVCDRTVWSIQGGPDHAQFSVLDTLVNRIWSLKPGVRIELSPDQ